MKIEIPHQVFNSKALECRSSHYPARYNGKVPLKVKILMNTGSDLPSFIKHPINVYKGESYFVNVNSHGAVSAIIDGEMLGLKPNEFEVVWWHE